MRVDVSNLTPTLEEAGVQTNEPSMFSFPETPDLCTHTSSQASYAYLAKLSRVIVYFHKQG
jgi:hypothetical protein